MPNPRLPKLLQRLACVVFLAGLALAAHAQTAPVSLFYMTTNPSSVRSFLAHSQKIGILVPTWYSVDENGLVTGAPNPEVLAKAHQENLPVMPIVGSAGKAAFHKLLGNPAAQSAMTASLIQQSKRNGYIGFQFDFENITWTDRDALSALVANSAAAFHAAGLKLSIATVPNAPGYPGASPFAHWIYADWRGAYDLKALAKSVDFISLMTYDQHTGWTTPGPVAGWNWVLENIKYALKVVPPQKLSLGIPLYGYHWYSGNPVVDGVAHPRVAADYISYADATLLAEEYHGAPQWDPVAHTEWYYIMRDQLREWVFYPNARAFSDRYGLVKQYHLAGFSSWVLGDEDPAIWPLLPARK